MISKVVYFIAERENIRHRKERGDPRPWTKDDILDTYRFCNVNREDDRTTREIHRIIAAKGALDADLPWMYTAARLCNYPTTLSLILDHPDTWHDRIRDKLYCGHTMFSNAYSITPAGAKMDRVNFMLETIEAVRAMRPPLSPYMCEDAAASLKKVRGLGDFMVGQIIADLKHSPFLCNAKDRKRFVLPGPGSIQGLDVIFESLTTTTTNFHHRLGILWNDLPSFAQDAVGDYQNLQNVCCEFAKYWRYTHGLPARKRYYQPFQQPIRRPDKRKRKEVSQDI